MVLITNKGEDLAFETVPLHGDVFSLAFDGNYQIKTARGGAVRISVLLTHFHVSDLPEPVSNCTAYNATAYTMQFTCVPGSDGGIKQSFFVEVIINSVADKKDSRSLGCF